MHNKITHLILELNNPMSPVQIFFLFSYFIEFHNYYDTFKDKINQTLT
jgi:hypothetical protein